jgi:hypothetical protein
MTAANRLDPAMPAFYGLVHLTSRGHWMISGFTGIRGRAILGLAWVAAILGACAMGDGPDPDARAGLGCVDDSAACIASRQKTLRHLVDDPGRNWIKEPPTPEAYASGVRLFAFKTKKKELTCDELAHGRKEAEAARASLKSAGSTLTAAQVSRGAMLATEVSRELQSEIARRCKKG